MAITSKQHKTIHHVEFSEELVVDGRNVCHMSYRSLEIFYSSGGVGAFYDAHLYPLLQVSYAQSPLAAGGPDPILYTSVYLILPQACSLSVTHIAP